jgi:hypothetical protein
MRLVRASRHAATVTAVMVRGRATRALVTVRRRGTAALIALIFLFFLRLAGIREGTERAATTSFRRSSRGSRAGFCVAGPPNFVPHHRGGGHTA